MTAGAERKGFFRTGWTPHAGRVGYATAAYLGGGASALPEISETCRWQSIKTLKIYLDVVGVVAGQLSQRLEREAGPLADFCASTYRPRLLTAVQMLRM